MNNIVEFVKNAFNLSIGTSNTPSGNTVNISNELYQRLNQTLKNNLGDYFFTCDISAENLMSYKNGKISSMLKKENEISKHYGFDIVSITNITDMLINEINLSLVDNVINNFNRIAFEIINSIIDPAIIILTHKD
jgi:hypothetical protein